MNRLILILILTFSLQSLTKGDDIKDFEIEGISIGDSVLDYKTLEYVQNILDDENTFYYKKGNYAVIGLDISSDLYKGISATIKPKDKKYIIHGIEGRLFFPNAIEDCKNKKDEIAKDILSIFPNKSYSNYNSAHDYDKTGKSFYYSSHMKLPNGNIELYCFDWSNEITESLGFSDELKLVITSREYREWINNEAYE